MTDALTPRADRHQLVLEIAQMAMDWRFGDLAGCSSEAIVHMKRMCETFAEQVLEQGVPPEPAALGAPSAPSETPAPSASVRTLADRLDALADNCAQTAVKSRTESNAEYLLARASTYQECAGLIREALR